MFKKWLQPSNEELIKAIYVKNEAETQKLIAKMDILELSKIYIDNTALIWAVDKGLEKVCEMLIPKMSEQAINQVTNKGCTALTWAIDKGLEKVCEMLIPKMSEQAISHVTDNGNTALTLAADKDLKKIYELLINKMSIDAINHTLTSSHKEAKKFIQEKISYNNILAEKLALFLKESFLGKGKDNINNFVKMISAAKFYKIVNKKLLTEYLQKQEVDNSKFIIEEMNNFIKTHSFTIARICKNLTPKICEDKIHISNLPIEIRDNIISYLENGECKLKL